MPAKKFARTIDGKLEWNLRPRRQVENLGKLLILIPADRPEAFKLPAHHRRETRSRRLGRRQPLIHAHRLPGMLPLKARRRHAASRGSNISPKREEPVESTEEFQIPLGAFRDCQ